MREQGCNSEGEVISAVYVKHDHVTAMHADDGVTRQEFADECDINILLAQYEKTGTINHYNSRSPEYLDVSDVPDLATSLDYLRAAEAAFMSLPAIVRKEFDNDAVKFVEYASDPANIDRMREWKLAPPKPAEQPAPSGGGEPPGPAPEPA